ncbi:hypothetical protein KR009_000286 [Drosophila setifemur]|nr:hypothetical protein KR009_000286 [Drosophila setifemur]
MPPRRAVGPRRMLTLEEKLEIIQTQEENKLTVRDLGKRFNIGKTQAADICRNKEAIRRVLITGRMRRTQIKRNPLSQQGAHIDQMCFDWFSKARNEGRTVNGESVREKAKELAETVGYSGFTASPGWLQKWQKRHNISFNQIDSTLDLEQFEAVLVKSEPVLVKSEPISNRDEDFSPNDVTAPIFTIEEALMQLTRLKDYCKDDYVSYQQLLSLENQWTWKWNSTKKEVP